VTLKAQNLFAGYSMIDLLMVGIVGLDCARLVVSHNIYSAPGACVDRDRGNELNAGKRDLYESIGAATLEHAAEFKNSFSRDGFKAVVGIV